MNGGETNYIEYAEAVALHHETMARFGDARCGVFSQSLIESALARPQLAAQYENADLIRQAATLWFGLIKNHPFLGGNRRTATFVTKSFLERNGLKVIATTDEFVELCALVQSDVWKVDEIENWLRERIKKTE